MGVIGLEPLFPLQLLPPGLDHSILIPVWVGALLLFWATESFGWGFVGLVVPGYLASVLISRPVSAMALVVEILLTFVCVKVHLDWLPRRGWIYTPFGRERFFLVVLWGSAVRIVAETWGFPYLFGALPPLWVERLGLDVWQPDFYGIGLVLVPLTANMLWRSNLITGGTQLLLVTGLTWLITRFVLLQATNLGLSEFQLVFEDAAVQLESQPKAYVILLVGALLAARANQLYGWDFNGILVPSLLGIAWLWPVKVASTFVEVLCVVLLARGLVSLPSLRTWNIEGPRRVTLILTVDLLYKATLVQAVPLLKDSISSADLFGFGYILPALLATKVWVRKDIPGILIPTLVVSIQSFVLGSAVAFILALVPLPQMPVPVETPPVPLYPERAPAETLADVVARAGRAVATENPNPAPQADALAGLSELLQPLLQRSGALPEHAAALAEVLGLQAVEGGGPGRARGGSQGAFHWTGFVEAPETLSELRGTGAFFRRTRGPSIESARWPALLMPPLDPHEDGARASLAAQLFTDSDAPVLAIPGGQVSLEGVLSPSLWPLPGSLEALPSWLILAQTQEGVEEGLYLPSGLDSSVPLEELTEVLGPLRLFWSALPASVLPWVETLEGQQAALVLSPGRWTRLAGALRGEEGTADASGPWTQPSDFSGPPAPPVEPPMLEGTEAAVLLSWTDPMAAPSPLPSRAQSELRMLRWLTEVVRPLLSALNHPAFRQTSDGLEPDAPGKADLERASALELKRVLEHEGRRASVPDLLPLHLELPAKGGVPIPREALLPLRQVARVAASFQYRLEVLFPEEGGPLVALKPEQPTLQRTAALILRPAAQNPLALFLTDAQDAGMLALSRQWLVALDAQALIVDGAPADLRVVAGREGGRVPAHATHASAFYEALVSGGLRASGLGPGVPSSGGSGSSRLDALKADSADASLPETSSPRMGEALTLLRLEALAAGRFQPAEVAVAGPALAGPALANPTLAGPALANPTLAGPALANPTLAAQESSLANKDATSRVAAALTGLGLRVALQQGEGWGASLRLPSTLTTGYSLAVGHEQVVVARVNRALRSSALGETSTTLLAAADYLGLTTSSQALLPRLQRLLKREVASASPELSRSLRAQRDAVLDAWTDWAIQGGSSRLIKLIELARAPAAAPGRRLELVQDRRTGRVFLLSLPGREAGPVWCLNLSALPPAPDTRLAPDSLRPSSGTPAELEAFVEGYAPLLWLEPPPLARLHPSGRAAAQQEAP